MRAPADPDGRTDLRTERLLLRRWRAQDRELFAALTADPLVMEHFPAPLERDASDALVDRADAHLAEHGWGLWAVEVAAGEDAGRLAGFTGLAVPRFEAAFTPCVEVGWRLARWAWGRGYATEAGRAALRVAFEDVGLDEVVSFTATTNERSRAVMGRLGMSRDPAEDFDHPALPDGHRLRRHVLHRLREESWRDRQG
ncbi:GNAT family N-acetyltransferase [Pseudokineococcus basanitobsidens]|uniref:GNAT family N-acetyltransferase n=1 Tax=Pseudokineococcus basanitobsidens TaxID=1926649 RepID=A0ABU8RFV7_9ACTN